MCINSNSYFYYLYVTMAKKFPDPIKYIPRNPEKYIGDHTNIWSRSSWETKFMVWLDRNKQVLNWQSETVVIPYVSPVDSKSHRYFVDFKAKIQSNNGEIKTYLIEIKPECQIQPPKPRKVTQKYITEVMTYGVNQAKWAAAERYAADRGYIFVKLNEFDLGIAEQKNG